LLTGKQDRRTGSQALVNKATIICWQIPLPDYNFRPNSCKGTKTIHSASLLHQQLHVATSMLSKTINCHVVNIHCQLMLTKKDFLHANNQESPTHASTQTVLLIFFSLSYYIARRPNRNVTSVMSDMLPHRPIWYSLWKQDNWDMMT